MRAKSMVIVIQLRIFPSRDRELRATGVSPWSPDLHPSCKRPWEMLKPTGTEKLTEGGGDFSVQVPLGHHPWSVSLCTDTAIGGHSCSCR